jgi:predicted aldo/keto reductase-like oxidoreductase
MEKETEGVFSGNVTRREFIRASALGVVGMNVSWAGLSLGQQEGLDSFKRIRQGDMYYRQLGRTGLMISEVSLGGSPVPPEDVFREAIERGVNYADTSSNYMGGNSERQIGKAMKGRRDKFHVSTKIRPGRRRGFKDTKESLIRDAEGSLRRLDTDYIDVLSCHGAPNPEILADEEVLAAFDQLKKDGKIRFTGVSCHRDPQWVLTDAIKSGNYDVISIAYNAYSDTQIEKDKVYDDYLERSGIEQVINLAREHDVGVIAMKSMAGGERQNLTAFRTEGVSLPQAKLKWVLENEKVTAVITEILSFDMLQEDLAVSTARMTSQERQALSDYVEATSRDYCRMCGTCLHHCPSDIAIPDIIRYALYYEGYGRQAIARTKYQSLSRESTILGCDFCRKCENACPYNLPIINKLHHAHQLLA